MRKRVLIIVAVVVAVALAAALGIAAARFFESPVEKTRRAAGQAGVEAQVVHDRNEAIIKDTFGLGTSPGHNWTGTLLSGSDFERTQIDGTTGDLIFQRFTYRDGQLKNSSILACRAGDLCMRLTGSSNRKWRETSVRAEQYLPGVRVEVGLPGSDDPTSSVAVPISVVDDSVTYRHIQSAYLGFVTYDEVIGFVSDDDGCYQISREDSFTYVGCATAEPGHEVAAVIAEAYGDRR